MRRARRFGIRWRTGRSSRHRPGRADPQLRMDTLHETANRTRAVRVERPGRIGIATLPFLRSIPQRRDAASRTERTRGRTPAVPHSGPVADRHWRPTQTPRHDRQGSPEDSPPGRRRPRRITPAVRPTSEPRPPPPSQKTPTDGRDGVRYMLTELVTDDKTFLPAGPGGENSVSLRTGPPTSLRCQRPADRVES